jgi:hypothetical protein
MAYPTMGGQNIGKGVLIKMVKVSGKKTGGCLGCLGWSIALGALAWGGHSLYSQWGGRGAGLTVSEAAQWLPAQATVAGFVRTEPQAWSRLAQFQSPETEQLLAQLQANLVQNQQIDFQQDVSPWLNNALVALMLPPEDATASEPALVAVVGVKDQNKAKDFLAKILKNNSLQVKSRQYQGFEAQDIIPSGGKTWSYALVGQKLLLASQPAWLNAALDTQKGKPSLHQVPAKSQLLEKTLNLPDPVMQFYWLDASGTLAALPQDSSSQLAKQLQENLKVLGSYWGGVAITDQGLHFQYLGEMADEPQNLSNLTANPNRLLAQLPADTVLVINGQGLAQSWSEWVKQAPPNSEWQSFLEQSRQIVRSNLNMDLDQELIGWMDGELALALVPTKSGFLGEWGVSGLVLLTTQNQNQAQSSVEHLDTQMRSVVPPFIQAQALEVKGVRLTEWRTLPTSQAVFAYGWLENNVFSLSLGDSLTPLVEVTPATSLAQNPQFLALTRALPKANLGYFYLNPSPALPAVAKIAALQGYALPPMSQQTLESIVAIAGTVSRPQANTSQLDLLVGLKKK